MSIRIASIACLSSALLLNGTVHAFGMHDSYADTPWWDTSSQEPVDSSVINSDALYQYGEQWWNQKWGARGALYQSDSTGLDFDNNKHLAVDVKRRLFTMRGNSYLAVGLGWDDIELPGDVTTSGMRLVAEGRYTVVGPAYLFGQASFTPWLSEIENIAGPNGKEIEFGLAVNPFPSMSLKAGYRNYWLDSGNPGDATSYNSGNNGLFIGGGVSW